MSAAATNTEVEIDDGVSDDFDSISDIFGEEEGCLRDPNDDDFSSANSDTEREVLSKRRRCSRTPDVKECNNFSDESEDQCINDFLDKCNGDVRFLFHLNRFIRYFGKDKYCYFIR